MKEKNKNDILLDILVKLEMEEKSILRNLNTYYFDISKKENLYKKLKNIRTEIQQTKFKLRMEREIKKNDRNSNSSESKK